MNVRLAGLVIAAVATITACSPALHTVRPVLVDAPSLATSQPESDIVDTRKPRVIRGPWDVRLAVRAVRNRVSSASGDPRAPEGIAVAHDQEAYFDACDSPYLSLVNKVDKRDVQSIHIEIALPIPPMPPPPPPEASFLLGQSAMIASVASIKPAFACADSSAERTTFAAWR